MSATDYPDTMSTGTMGTGTVKRGKRALRAAALITIGAAAAYLVQLLSTGMALAAVALLCSIAIVGMASKQAKERRREAAAAGS